MRLTISRSGKEVESELVLDLLVPADTLEYYWEQELLDFELFKLKLSIEILSMERLEEVLLLLLELDS